jgi:cytidylate kinase
MTVKKLTIIISGMPGTGKTTLEHNLAKRFGLKIFTGSDVFKDTARKEGYNPDKVGWWESKEGFEFLKKRNENPEFDKEVDEVAMDVAREGNVVITSWTLPYLKVQGIKIFIIASQEERARRIAQRDGINFDEALQHIKKRDEENRKLYKKIYGFTLGKDLDVFDIVIDTDGMQAEEVERQVVEKIKMMK